MVDSKTTPAGSGKTVPKKKKQPMWLLYGALIIGGLLFLAEAVGMAPLQRSTARIGLALLYSALALIVGNGRTVGYVATAIVCLSALIVYFV
ncbi:hypothetical protein KQH51_03645 [bacterium]|nr:hypothetical protein [bacterium]MCB2202016.1 hypothetical protein [bacterium]